MLSTLQSDNFRMPATDQKRHSAPEEITTDKHILFIGSHSSFISYDIIEELGYTTILVNTIHEAKSVLASWSFNSPNIRIEAIICDIQMDEQLIKHFSGYISVTKELNNVPLILFANEGQNILNNNTTAIKGVDDIISNNVSAADLVSKIKVLKKYKTLKNKLPYQACAAPVKPFNFQYTISRGVDIVLAISLLVALSPFLLLIIIAVKLDSKGPVFYISPRAGRGYRVFKFYKFRTMIVDADKNIEEFKHLNQYKDAEAAGSVFIKIDQDPRITRVGKFLRNTSLDELPQLINVLLGDMSLVGNRPLPLYEACSLTVDQSAQRFLAPAGMTGLWQIKGRGHSDMSAAERINLDIDYANRHSFLYDMYILLNTPKGLIQKTDV